MGNKNKLKSEGTATIVQTKQNLGLFFENGRFYTMYSNSSYGPILEKEDVTDEIVKALKPYFTSNPD